MEEDNLKNNARDEFASRHAEICSGVNHPRRKSPSARMGCGRNLYDFLKKHGIPFDIRYNQKKFKK